MIIHCMHLYEKKQINCYFYVDMQYKTDDERSVKYVRAQVIVMVRIMFIVQGIKLVT